MHRLLQHANDGGRACAKRRPPGERDDGAEDDEEEHLGDRPVHAGQEDRDDDDRPELSRDAVAENRGAERRLEQAGVGQDRDERPERRRRERDAEDPALGVDARLLEDRPGDETDRQRHRPAGRAEPERAARNALLDHLEPGEEEQEHEPEGGEELDVRVGVREAERLRADEDPEDDLDDDGRQEQPVMQPREDRRDGRRGKDEDERADVGCDHRRAQRALRGAIPHELVNEAPGSRRISASPLRNAFGGHVIGSTARLRRLTSGRGSPVKSIR